MERMPTLIVVPSAAMWRAYMTPTTHSSDINGNPLIVDAQHRIQSTLQVALASGLPAVFAAPHDVGNTARNIMAAKSVIDVSAISTREASPSELIAQAIVAGVLVSANSNGWLVVSTDTPSLSAESLLCIANAMNSLDANYPMYKRAQGFLVGFSKELFSELIRIKSEGDLFKLISRYPSMDIEIEIKNQQIGNKLEEIPTRLSHMSTAHEAKHFRS